MSETSRLKLPFILPAQAQKHVTHNEALVTADALIQLAALTRSLTTPPSAPVEGARYLLPVGVGGSWVGRAGMIAAFEAGAWVFHGPTEGWRCWIADEARLVVHAGGAWQALRTEAPSELAKLGIGTAADTSNRLAVKADAALFTHDDATPGTGDMRITLNKSAAARDSGFVFQTGYSSRALFGTFGSDAFGLKVSADGATFVPVLSAESSGKLALGGSIQAGATQPIQLGGAVLVSSDRVTVEAASAAGVALHLSNKQSGAHGGYLLSATGAGAFSVADQANGVRLLVGPTGNVTPGADNTVTLGEAGKRFSAVYAATGVIQTSDARDKTDVAPLDVGLALGLLDAVEPVTFRWCDDSGMEAENGDRGTMAAGDAGRRDQAVDRRPQAGFLAQDVRAGLAAAGSDLGLWGLTDAADADSRQWLRPDQMIPLLWKALRETRREVAALCRRLDEKDATETS